MVRKTQSTATATATPAPAVVAVTVEAPAVEKKTRKPKAVAPAPVVEAPAPVAEVAAAPAEPVAEETLSSKLADFGSKIQQVAGILSSMRADYKALEKSVSKELKNASKSKKAKKASTGNKQPSGFVKPTAVSEELLKFLGKPAGTLMSRVEVSKEIIAYINANSLKDKTHGRQINADAKLGQLLRLGQEDVLTFFNLQKFLKVHFIK
jgi:chromatin remodeling complex protein RSC6